MNKTHLATFKEKCFFVPICRPDFTNFRFKLFEIVLFLFNQLEFCCEKIYSDVNEGENVLP